MAIHDPRQPSVVADASSMSDPTMHSKRALILGGGGAVGVAWEIGVLAGLLDGGIDVRIADVTVGTSAGAIVGSQIAPVRDPRELFDVLAAHSPRPGDGGAPERDLKAAGEAFGIWGGSAEMTVERCAAVGAAALRATTVSEADYLANFELQIAAEWPAKTLIVTAVDCASGELRTFDRSSGISLPRAVSASCCVPALFPPVAIDARRYMDGGGRSGTSADLAVAF
jgi:NTE family protein